jgi:adenosylmethionine-8-amino-7-oxononanoate aminotransferase
MEEALADLEATLKQHSDAIAAMILEPVSIGRYFRGKNGMFYEKLPKVSE